QRIVEVHVQLAAAAMEVPPATVQTGVRTQALDAGQSLQFAEKPIVEIRKDPVGRWWKPVPVVERALFLDGIAIAPPRGVVERRNVALERFGDVALEEVIDHDMRERLRLGEDAA